MIDLLRTYLAIAGAVGCAIYFASLSRLMTDQDAREVADECGLNGPAWFAQLARSLVGVSVIFGLFWPVVLWVYARERGWW